MYGSVFGNGGIMGVWLVSTKKKDAVYEVLEYNKVSKVAKLKGKYAIIEQVLDKETMKKAGYKLTQENPNAEQS
jgi:hypothetical protein